MTYRMGQSLAAPQAALAVAASRTACHSLLARAAPAATTQNHHPIPRTTHQLALGAITRHPLASKIASSVAAAQHNVLVVLGHADAVRKNLQRGRKL